MSIGDTLPYRRSALGRSGRFATGSLVFDLHRPINREDAAPPVTPPMSTSRLRKS